MALCLKVVREEAIPEMLIRAAAAAAAITVAAVEPGCRAP
jgi:hypothetical protein